MKAIVWWFGVLLVSPAATNSCLAEEKLICPSRVRLASGSVVSEDVPPGYTPFVPGGVARLTGVTVFDGPPEDGAALKPSSISSSGERVKWVFEGTYEKGKWISCDYEKGLITLVRQVAEPASTCAATIKKTKPYNNLEAGFSCR